MGSSHRWDGITPNTCILSTESGVLLPFATNRRLESSSHNRCLRSSQGCRKGVIWKGTYSLPTTGLIQLGNAGPEARHLADIRPQNNSQGSHCIAVRGHTYSSRTNSIGTSQQSFHRAFEVLLPIS